MLNKIELQNKKQAFRKKLIKNRKKMQNKAKKDSIIFKKLIALPEFADAELILTYVSTTFEVDTKRLTDYCFNKKIAVAVPAIINEKLCFYSLNPDFTLDLDYQVSAVNYQLCVVPGLAFDTDNRRLGYGGGYYDRFLREYTGVKVGLCYGEFVLDIPVEEHDEKVDILIAD
ncbi:MAG: 5-formyltetrahydrofolate cyclo-ligase [Oscillospiraceae bacterium]|nr:5-formyltetrahydrofolate cyclo-ligase [Oscillospiraceae bacterium]